MDLSNTRHDPFAIEPTNTLLFLINTGIITGLTKLGVVQKETTMNIYSSSKVGTFLVHKKIAFMSIFRLRHA